MGASSAFLEPHPWLSTNKRTLVSHSDWKPGRANFLIENVLKYLSLENHARARIFPTDAPRLRYTTLYKGGSRRIAQPSHYREQRILRQSDSGEHMIYRWHSPNYAA
jgi:hypothetical protein